MPGFGCVGGPRRVRRRRRRPRRRVRRPRRSGAPRGAGAVEGRRGFGQEVSQEDCGDSRRRCALTRRAVAKGHRRAEARDRQAERQGRREGQDGPAVDVWGRDDGSAVDVWGRFGGQGGRRFGDGQGARASPGVRQARNAAPSNGAVVARGVGVVDGAGGPGGRARVREGQRRGRSRDTRRSQGSARGQRQGVLEKEEDGTRICPLGVPSSVARQ
mmetsp:Transcript_28491/g.95936  ORF Transcript_28491/g.95936 Transcript_28491/m.95936 type:complete len:215 (+) Transcript_28491:1288-1932(+)